LRSRSGSTAPSFCWTTSAGWRPSAMRASTTEVNGFSWLIETGYASPRIGRFPS
jgi:hypothetical protein